MTDEPTDALLERARAAIHDLLGDVTELPLLFESRMFCPSCLGRGLMMAGQYLYCPGCGAEYRGTVLLTRQGRHYLALNDI